MTGPLKVDTSTAPSVVSSRLSPSIGLTTFPNPFQDEPEQGILPALFSKVKQTFTSSAAPVAGPSQPKADKGGAGSDEQSWGYGGDYGIGGGQGLGLGMGQGRDGQKEGGPVVQTEAQAIAEAVKRNRAQMAIAATAADQAQAKASEDQYQQARRQTFLAPAVISQPVDGVARVPPNVAGPSVSPQRPRGHARSYRPPLSTVNSIGSTLSQPQLAPSIVSSHQSSVAPPKRSSAPSERHWKPSDVAPAQVTIFPVTTTVAVQNTTASKEPPPPAPPATGPVPFPVAKPFHRAHFGLQNAVPSSSRSVTPLHHHSRSNSMVMGAAQNRMRRASIATLPDSPSSASISGMLSGSLEQGQGYLPGFPMAQDDARSVRSLGVARRLNSVSKVIRRMRGEGLSKQYWMADEHCKECYDCKSAFTAWRRKHHCRICGQIFCSRCASNIIGARRFGQEGVVRVCNLCLKIMEEYKDDDEDDRRSINSVSTSVHRYPSVSDRAFLDSAISPEMAYAKSPFAASQLFTSQPNETLTAIDESSVPTRWGGGDMDLERPYTPNDIGGSQMSDGDDGQSWTHPPQTAAPFRRPMEEEQKMHEEEEDAQPNTPWSDSPDVGGDTSRHGSETGHKGGEMRRGGPLPRVEFPMSYATSTDGGDMGRSLSREDYHPLMSLRTRVSQAGLTALLDTEKNEGLWRARSHSFASKKPEMLSGASLQHFYVMLEQAIARADLPKPAEWHRVLSKLILKVPVNLQPNVRAGDDIDLRAYVKIKKVPGGKISDSEYVDGIVISKNVTHKAMPRRLVNPRIMVITFPLDYHRVDNQFMSLDPILAQEKDYLRLLTKRIIDVRPHIVLVGPTASRIALEYLLEADIAVARGVKPSAIHQVARCTQADILASMDRLVLQPRLGRCNEVRIETYDHDLIPGRRKTLMRFEGGNREQGGTIILRGGDLETLRKVKVVTDFMALVAYHLKNEVILYNDEHNILPPDPPLPAEYQELLELLREKEPQAHDTFSSNVTIILPEAETPSTSTPTHRGTDLDPETPTTPTPYRVSVNEQDDDRQVERREALEVTRQIARSLEPYLTTVLSASAAIRFPPPATLARMAQLDRRLAELRQSRDEEEAAQILEEETKAPEPPKTAVLPPAGADPETASISTVTSTGGEAPEPAAALEVTSSAVMSATPAMSSFSTVGGGMQRQLARDPYRVLRKPEEVSRESALAQVTHEHAEQLKLWQWYNRRFTEQLRPENYQRIVYLSSLGCEGTEKPCVEPTVHHIDFYHPGDQTIGQFLESLAASAADLCPSKTCERLLLFHFHLLVHGERRLQIAMDQFPCPSPGHEEQIITWSYCRQCGTPSPTTIIREETWKLSWGSYLEHCFYPPETSAGFSCPHDAFRDQIRYFAHRNLAIRIHNEKIDLYEPCRPSVSLQVKAETKVALKNREYESALAKNTSFFDSVLFRLKALDYDMVQPEKVAPLKTMLENMLSRAVADREEMVNLLNRTYKLTPVTDVLALNTVLRTLQDKVVQWDSDFADVEKAFMPSEKDLRRMTASHLKRLFANQDVFSTLDRNVTGLTVSEVDEKETKDSLSPNDTPAATKSSTPTLRTPTAGVITEEPSSLDITSDKDAVETPLAEIVQTVEDPLANLVGGAAEAERSVPSGYASDSTVSAMRRESIGRSPVAGDRVESSGMDSDAHPFVSRLPRRSRPAPSIADLVQRFNESTQLAEEPLPEIERPRSSGPLRRQQPYQGHEQDVSDSDNSPKSRLRLRRGRSDQPPVRYREASVKRGLVSDGERSYAANASRIPSSYGRQTMAGGAVTDYLRPGMRSRTPSYTGKASPRSGRVSPEPRTAGPSSCRQTPVSSLEAKPRIGGKGKHPKLPETPSGRTSPSMIRTGARRTLASSSRVTSIARHFDRLSREAERERLKRMSIVRNKRARPVSVTKAKVQVFDNLRDAFRDEFDTDSSEADNEEDEMGSDDSLGSEGQPGQTKARRRASPVKKASSVKATTLHEATTPPIEPISVQSSSPSLEQGPSAAGGADNTVSGSSVPAPSIFSDAKSEMSFTDRLQIELPSFETSAPLPSHPTTPQISNDVSTVDEGKGTMSASQVSDSEFGTFSTTGERSSILKSLTGLWAFRAGEFAPLEYPLSASEHIFADSRVIIRENEPTSIIAFTLSSKTYRDNSRAWASNKAGVGKYETFMPEEGHTGDRTVAWDVVSLDDVDEPARPEGGTHLKYDFESGASTIFCRIFFAEQFAALRKACQCEDSFVESLARCVQFEASGGKSGSAFLKTKDDRFIAKEITRFEMDSLTKFAPAYFEYTRKAFQGQRPTVLAKIYGFFKIGYHNAITGKYMKMNVLIMENLFYERRFTKIYDLKGSTRNRLIQPTGRVNEVLLDENLMEIVYKHPLYLRDQSKRILRTALFNDTLFLSNLNVMDYSLVVGVDKDKQELVVGIVDYIRTFTWDKKLESWVKDLGAGGKGEPTIVTPKQYKLRFRTAMERFYFPSVPDRWTKVESDEVQMEDEAGTVPVVVAVA